MKQTLKWQSIIASQVHIQALQSLMPATPTQPRHSFTLDVPNRSTAACLLHRRFHALFFHSQDQVISSGWHAAGWIKESLGQALQQRPLFAGRVTECQESDACDRVKVVVVSNDSGARMVEAMAKVKMDEVVRMEGKGGDDGHLVFWGDAYGDEEGCLQFSPLFYVQVTNFTCGGYSIGISCSLLVVDPFTLTTFIKTWADIHANIVSSASDGAKTPTFFLPKIENLFGASNTLLAGNTTNNITAQNVLFKVLNLDNIDKSLAEFCIDQAEKEASIKMGSTFTLVVMGPDHATVETCLRHGGDSSGAKGIKCERISWDDELGMENVWFNPKKKSVCVSSWISPIMDQGLVMFVPFGDGAKVIVTFT